jgi:hypothetical protein
MKWSSQRVVTVTGRVVVGGGKLCLYLVMSCVCVWCLCLCLVMSSG